MVFGGVHTRDNKEDIDLNAAHNTSTEVSGE